MSPSKEIFVFGSNEQGIHRRGAAKYALDVYDAQMYQTGLMDKCYGLNTKKTPYLSLSISEVEAEINKFIDCAQQHPDMTFLVTRVGCGLAGFKDAEIAPLFQNAPDNCIFDIAWIDLLPNKRYRNFVY